MGVHSYGLGETLTAEVSSLVTSVTFRISCWTLLPCMPLHLLLLEDTFGGFLWLFPFFGWLLCVGDGFLPTKSTDLFTIAVLFSAICCACTASLCRTWVFAFLRVRSGIVWSHQLMLGPESQLQYGPESFLQLGLHIRKFRLGCRG